MGGDTGSSSSSQGPSKPHCKACQSPVKDHFGPHGVGKCVVGLLAAFRQRIERLETDLVRSQTQYCADLDRLSKSHTDRLDGLLGTITMLETKVSSLEKENSELNKTVSNLSSTCARKDEIARTELGCARYDKLQDGTSAGEGDQGEQSGSKSLSTGMASTEDNGRAKKTNDEHATSKESTEAAINIVERKKNEPEQGGARTNEPKPEDSRPWSTIVSRGKAITGPGRSMRSTSYSTNADTSSSKLAGTARAPKPGFRLQQPLGKLAGAPRVKKKVFYVGGIDPACTAEDLKFFCEKKHCPLLACRFLPSRRSGTQAAYVVIADSQTSSFLSIAWPEYLYTRPWTFEEKKGNPSPTTRNNNSDLSSQ